MLELRLLIAVIIAAAVWKSTKLVPIDERLVVFRLGRFHDVIGPGFVFLIPIIDKPLSVDLSKHLPSWKSLSPDELKVQLRDLVLHDPNPEKLAQ